MVDKFQICRFGLVVDTNEMFRVNKEKKFSGRRYGFAIQTVAKNGCKNLSQKRMR